MSGELEFGFRRPGARRPVGDSPWPSLPCMKRRHSTSSFGRLLATAISAKRIAKSRTSENCVGFPSSS